MITQDVTSSPVATIGPTASARQAARLMRDRGVGSVVVVDEQCKPLAIVTDRDLALHVLRNGLDPARAPAMSAEMLSRPLITAPETIDLQAAARLMRSGGVRRLPLVDAEGRVTGIRTSDDMLCSLTARFDLLASAVGHGRDLEFTCNTCSSTTFGAE